jgi:hypothetical protein
MEIAKVGTMTQLSSNRIAALTPTGLALLFVFSSFSPIWSQPKTPAATPTAQSPGRDSLAVKALRAEAGKPSLYEVSFITTDTLASNAAIVMTFPAAFDLSQLEIAGSSTINGGFTLERKGQEVLLRRSGLGAKIPPGKKVSIQLGLIVNPANLSASHQVRVQLPPPSGAPTTAATPKNTEVQFITSVN